MIFNLQSIAVVILLAICTATYLRPHLPSYIDPRLKAFPGVFGRFAVVGERLSPYVSLGCFSMAAVTLFSR